MSILLLSDWLKILEQHFAILKKFNKMVSQLKNTCQVDHGLAHGHVHGTHERPPLIQHLLGGVGREVGAGVPDDGP